MRSPASSPHNVVKTAFIVAAVLVLAILLWQLTEVWVLCFAAVLFAIVLRSLAAQIEKYAHIPSPFSLMLSILLVAGIAALFVFLVGFQIKEQFANLIRQIPEYIESVGEQLNIDDLQGQMTERIEEMGVDTGLLVGVATTYTTGTVSAIASFFLMLIIGIYLAANPYYYLRGVLKLVPAPYTESIRDTLLNIGTALGQWLGGQLIIMLIVGTLVSIGLTVIGMPSALALGFMAGVSEFVPILGPLVASLPAILIAVSEDFTTLLWVIALYVAVQQLESYVIMPLVQRRAVHLPPVLTILSIVGSGILLGLPGVVLAAPLAVTFMVAVERLYVRRTLHKPVDVPGEKLIGKNTQGKNTQSGEGGGA